MSDKQQSIYFIAITFLFAAGAGLIIFQQFQNYYDQKAQIDLEAASTVTPAKKVTKAFQSIASTTADQISGWKTYKNDEYGFEFQYPVDYVTTGKKAINSTLGTAHVNVGGIYLGPIVIVPLTSQDLVAQAKQYMAIDCGKDLVFNNIKINYLDCADGGPAYYGYIKGPKLDFFIDGYSCGCSAEDCGDIYSNGPARYVKKEDLQKIFSTFKFTN